MTNPEVHTCANPQCNSSFKRLGEGQLHAFPVKDPKAWGLPEDAKQKAVWLCERCAAFLYIRVDQQHHRIRLVQKYRRARVA